MWEDPPVADCRSSHVQLQIPRNKIKICWAGMQMKKIVLYHSEVKFRGLKGEHTYCMTVYCQIVYKAGKTAGEISHRTRNVMEGDAYRNHVNMNQKEGGNLCWGCTHTRARRIKIALDYTPLRFYIGKLDTGNQDAMHLENSKVFLGSWRKFYTVKTVGLKITQF